MKEYEYSVSITKRGKRGAYLRVVAKQTKAPAGVPKSSGIEICSEYVTTVFGNAIDKAKSRAREVVNKHKERTVNENNMITFTL